MANEKQPTLEPIQSKTKDGLATVYTILAVLAWMGGIVLTAFAVLAFLDMNPFTDFFNALLDEGVSVLVIVAMALGTLFSGLFLMTIGKVIRLLKRMSTMSYSIRGLDSVMPKVAPERASGREERKEKEASKERSHEKEIQQAGQGAVSITFNVQGSLAPEVTTSEAPALEDKAEKKTAQ